MRRAGSRRRADGGGPARESRPGGVLPASGRADDAPARRLARNLPSARRIGAGTGTGGDAISGWPRWWIALTATWLLLAGSLDAAEWLAGGLAAALLTIVVRALEARGLGRFRGRARWLKLLRWAAVRVPMDTLVVFHALALRLLGRPRRSSFLAVPFDPGTDGPVGLARRAVVTGALSATPNTYVVAIDRKRKLLLLHRLEARGTRMTEELTWLV